MTAITGQSRTHLARDRVHVCASQVAMFDLSQPAPDPTYLNLTTVLGGGLSINAVRVLAASATATQLVIGGPNSQNQGLLVYGSVAVGTNNLAVKGSTVVPASQSGVTALSQTSTLQPNSLLAATDLGVYKCAA